MNQTYLIIPKDSEPFGTNWFDADSNFTPGMIVFNIEVGEYTNDGVTWQPIEEDHL